MSVNQSTSDSQTANRGGSSRRLAIVLRSTVSGLMAILVGFLAAWATPYLGHQLIVFAIVTVVCWAGLYGRPTPTRTVSIGLGIATVVTALAPLGLYIAAGWQWPASSWTNVDSIVGHAFWVLGFWQIAAAFAVGSALCWYYDLSH